MIEQILSPELVQAIGWSLVHSLWQAAAFALGLGALLVALRKFSARARYNVAISTLVAFFLTVALTFGGLYQRSEASPAPVTMATPTATAITPASTTSPAPATSPALTISPAPAVVPSPFRTRVVNYYNEHLPLIVTLWLMGVLILQLRFVGQLAYLQRLKNYGTERFPAKWAPMLQELETAIGVSKPVRYLSSFRVGSPFTAGWLRPVVLFPASLLAELNEPALRTIMAHELAHIRRHDFLVNLAQTLLCILFFYHPAVWWMSSRIEEEREHCCDDLAVAVTGERVGYARTLIQLKEGEATPQMAMGYLGRGGGFKQRVTRLLSGYLGTGTYREGFTSAVIIAGIMALAVTLSAQRENTVDDGDFVVRADRTLPVAGPAAPARPVGPQRPTPPPPPGGNHVDIFDDSTSPVDFVMPAEDSTAFIFFLEAIDDGNVELARFLLKQGIDVNETDQNGWTPLMVAAGENQAQIVALLIAAGAEVDYVNRSGWTALIEAADEGSYESAELLLAAGADVNLTGPNNNRTALAMAASEGKTRVFSLLVQHGADIFSVNGKGSPLHEAAEEGKIDIVKRLIDLGADAGARDENGRAPLSYAAEEGKDGVVRYLLRNGANPNDIDDGGRTALHYAAREANAGVTKVLLSRGAQPTMKDKNGFTPLDYALEELSSPGPYWSNTHGGKELSGNEVSKRVREHPLYEVIRALVMAGANSPLIDVADDKVIIRGSGRWEDSHGAFDNEDSDGQFDAGFDQGHDNATDPHPPHAGSLSGSDDLVTAVANGRNRRIDELLQQGEDPNRVGPNGRTPLTEASYHNYNVHTLQLVKGGADPDKTDGNGFTPLTMAATHNHIPTLGHLLQLGADPDREDGNGVTAKDIALRDGSAKMLKVLNDAGGSVTALNADGTSPLEVPAREGEMASLLFLLQEGADPDGGNGCSPVFYAAQEGHANAVHLLARHKADLEKGCDYRDSDFFGRAVPGGGGRYAVYQAATPLMIAITQRNAEATKALLNGGAMPNATCRKFQYHSEDPIDLNRAENLTVRELALVYDLRFNVSGWTPLMEAVMSDRPELVKVLLAAGADKRLSVTGGVTALSLAREIGNRTVISLLNE